MELQARETQAPGWVSWWVALSPGSWTISRNMGNTHPSSLPRGTPRTFPAKGSPGQTAGLLPDKEGGQ